MPKWSLSETLFASSTALLFGRVFDGLTLVTDDGTSPPSGGASPPRGAPAVLRALQGQVANGEGSVGLAPALARIYGFSFQGNYYKLPEPTVFLVYGEGQPVPPSIDNASLGIVGVEYKLGNFTDNILMWAVDQADYTVRIDISPGWFADVLLEPGLNDGTNMTTGQGPEINRTSSSRPAQLVGRGHMVGRGNSG